MVMMNTPAPTAPPSGHAPQPHPIVPLHNFLLRTRTTHIQQPLPDTFSAEQAELLPLTTACKTGEGKRIAIFSDSAYAIGICQIKSKFICHMHRIKQV
jgi:hypothetical protein